MNTILFFTGLTLLLLTLLLFILLHNEKRRQRELEKKHQRQQSQQRWQELELPEGYMIYQRQEDEVDYLFSENYPLTANPDYVIKLMDGRLVPIEIKSTVKNVGSPHSYHVIQVAADCLLLEEISEVPPTHGLLRYADHTFTIEYTPALRRKVLKLLDQMNQLNENDPPVLLKQKAERCRACTFKPICAVGSAK